MLPGQRSCAQEPIWNEDQYFLDRLASLWHHTPCICNTVTNLYSCYIDCASFCDIPNWYGNQPECNGFWSRQELRIWLNICSCGLTMMLGPKPSKPGQRRRRRNSISAIPDTSQDITIMHLLNSPYDGIYELFQGTCFCADWKCSMKQTITCSATVCEFSRCQHHTSIEVWTNMQIVLVNTGLWCHKGKRWIQWTSNATPKGTHYKPTRKSLNHALNANNDLSCIWGLSHHAGCQCLGWILMWSRAFSADMRLDIAVEDVNSTDREIVKNIPDIPHARHDVEQSAQLLSYPSSLAIPETFSSCPSPANQWNESTQTRVHSQSNNYWQAKRNLQSKSATATDLTGACKQNCIDESVEYVEEPRLEPEARSLLNAPWRWSVLFAPIAKKPMALLPVQPLEEASSDELLDIFGGQQNTVAVESGEEHAPAENFESEAKYAKDVEGALARVGVTFRRWVGRVLPDSAPSLPLHVYLGLVQLMLSRSLECGDARQPRESFSGSLEKVNGDGAVYELWDQSHMSMIVSNARPYWPEVTAIADRLWRRDLALYTLYTLLYDQAWYSCPFPV